ncbi:hypothetical protein BEUL_0435 [Bifidobacterium eulemuris]|uniref:Uncharacterized protein n=2 Tax=Bifidobacterium TaxID=1678 RepID=A0A261FU72_9BIFI|nr:MULTISPECIES: hypothetical protein [Bifidobacterium]OZG62493.1 hypothetical protein BLEM_1039 [Bifidobacterium lemurum]OZG69029.1 hypothetical protein BEUL_0435 [Bifidobacterium eulemuris]QOL31443.1 hypothetical protein BE0216_02455 [Bifidobacterium eulemuris]QOL33834.1 hypothetical protein BL8807_08625 [Bifidobacterium lemurum]
MKGNYSPLRRDRASIGAAFGGSGQQSHGDKVMLSLRVPSDLKMRFKTEAVSRGRSMEECLVDALEQWLGGDHE